jgi:hypothetical protein
MDGALIVSLAMARAKKDDVKNAINKIQQAMYASPAYKSLECDLQSAVQEEANALEAVQTGAFADFNVTGEKHPHEAITIKEYNMCEIIDLEKAREWCFDNYRPGLSIDERAFIDLAKKKRVPEEFIKSYSQFRAAIAQDLSAYLPKEEEVPF